MTKKNWRRKQNLSSLYDREYNNLTDAINTHCNSDFDANINCKRLSEFIVITRELAQIAIGSWL
jgi:hypothetical protein